MAKRTAGLLRHWGSRDHPTPLRDVVQRMPSPASAPPPPEYVRRAATRTLYVSSSPDSKPAATIKKIENGLWRVDISEVLSTAAGPRINTVRQNPVDIANGITKEVDCSGHRPNWQNLVYFPRPSLRPKPRELQRFNGRPVTPAYIFGNDARQTYQDTSYPWCCACKLYNSNNETGTAALVGPNLAVTAGHAIPWGQANASVRIVPDYYDGQSLLGAGVEAYATEARGYNTNDHVAGYDWAILKLDRNLGDDVGYFGFNGYSDDWNDDFVWTAIGYPADISDGEEPSRQLNFDIHKTDGDSNGGKELESNTADITPGDSGGPIFAWWNNDPRLVGVVSGMESSHGLFSSSQFNIFSSGSGFCNLIAWGRSNW